MQTPVSAGQHEHSGIVYRVACQNPGCCHTFDLLITPKRAGILAGTIACPRCSRHGGMLRPVGRLANRLFSAKLTFKRIGVDSTVAGEKEDLAY
jgi:hypothetical protein